ncbi:hypothetical protein PInf_017714 [Phytophthora infestans]|nr:hypothetical protein PInf_017714 [Phytophthora infestans]
MLSKFKDNGSISDASTNSAAEGTSAVRTKEEASATEDSVITEGDLEECSEQVLRDAEPVIDDRANFKVIRPSIVGEVNSAMITMTTISAGNNHGVTANSALKDPAVRNDLEAVPACPVVNSAMGMAKTCIIQSTAVDSASADLNAESDPNAATACRQDVSYTGEELAFRQVRSAVSVNSMDQRYDATEYYDSRKVLLHEGIKPNDDPATADSALETMEAKTGSVVVRRRDDDTIYLGDKLEHAEVKPAIVVDSVDMGLHVDNNYALSDVLLLRCIGTEIGITSSVTTVFDPRRNWLQSRTS